MIGYIFELKGLNCRLESTFRFGNRVGVSTEVRQDELQIPRTDQVFVSAKYCWIKFFFRGHKTCFVWGWKIINLHFTSRKNILSTVNLWIVLKNVIMILQCFFYRISNPAWPFLRIELRCVFLYIFYIQTVVWLK